MKLKSVIPFIVLLCLVFSGANLAIAQSKTKIGLRLAPSLSMTRVKNVDEEAPAQYDSYKSGLNFSAGINADFFFAQNYAFSTGLWYTGKRLGVQENVIKREDGVQTFNSESISVTNNQYIQAPITLKLYTNEVASDMKIYFQLGGLLDIKLSENLKTWKSTVNERRPRDNAYSALGVSFYFGSGVEYQLGENTVLFGGLGYQRRLTNNLSKNGPFPKASHADDTPQITAVRGERDGNARKAYRVYGDLLSVEFGIKF
jgi:hypothetical protein